MALATPGVADAVNIVGFSGATFTNRAECRRDLRGARSVRRARRGSEASRPPRSRAQLFGKLASIQEALIMVVPPPPVQGIGNAGGFRMMVEDRAGAGSQALQDAVDAVMGAARPDARRSATCSRCSRSSTPQLYLDIDRTKAQLLGVNMPDVFTALQIYIGSLYVNDFNLFGRTFRVTAQAEADRFRHTTRGRAEAARAQCQRRDRAARLLHHGARHLRPVSRAALQSLSGGRTRRRRRRPATRRARRSPIMEQLAAEVLPDGFSYEWTTLAFQQLRAGNTAMFAFTLGGGVRVPGAGGAVRKPDAAARGHPDRADVPGGVDHRRGAARAGQQHPDAGRLHRADRARGQERHL